MTQPFVSVILLAGGRGSRLGTAVPKQFLALRGKSMAIHSFERFFQSPHVSEIIVVARPEYHHLFATESKKILFAEPGQRRQDSVRSGLSVASQESEFICIHDSARPFVTDESLTRVLEAAFHVGAAALGAPMKNTVKRVDESQHVIETLPRETLWQIHTPQVIRKDWLEKGVLQAEKAGVVVTDDVALVERLGLPVQLIEESFANFKITTSEDFLLAQRL